MFSFLAQTAWVFLEALPNFTTHLFALVCISPGNSKIAFLAKPLPFRFRLSLTKWAIYAKMKSAQRNLIVLDTDSCLSAKRGFMWSAPNRHRTLFCAKTKTMDSKDRCVLCVTGIRNVHETFSEELVDISLFGVH